MIRPSIASALDAVAYGSAPTLPLSPTPADYERVYRAVVEWASPKCGVYIERDGDVVRVVTRGGEVLATLRQPVEVIEEWHEPAGPGVRHTIVINGAA